MTRVHIAAVVLALVLLLAVCSAALLAQTPEGIAP